MPEINVLLTILKYLFPAGIGASGAFLGIVLVIFLYPGKVDEWRAMVWGWIEKLGILYKTANKAKIKYSIQGNVTEFANILSTELPQFSSPSIKIEWVDEAANRKAFIDNGNAVIRLRRDDSNHENSVSACLLFVSQIMLRKSSRYISPTQRESIELYVGYKMLVRQSEEVFDAFVDKWLFPGIEKDNVKVSEYFDRYKLIDQSSFFLPIYLQELIYLGDKVFGRKRDDSIIHEVDGALAFLELHSKRKIGEKIETEFNGNVCRFAIMIVGRVDNIEEESYDLYIKHIREHLIPSNTETIYFIGPSKNMEFMRQLTKKISDEYNCLFSRNYSVILHSANNEPIDAVNHLCVLRRKQRIRYVG